MTTRLVPEDAPLQPGHVISGRYRVERELGQGGMARVYEVQDLELNERIALKVLDRQLSRKQEVLRQFRQEIRLARRVIHRNVCRIHDLGHSQDLWFVTMELIEGETLATLQDRKALGDLFERLSLFRDVLIGLRAAHTTGIVHLDIKPGNIMITGDGRTVLMDFGLAGPQGQPGATTEDAILGTPAYMPPERFLGVTVGVPADIYSLGVLLFELMTDRIPFDGTTANILRSHLSDAPPNVLELQPETPPAIARAIAGMLEKDPKKRLSSVDQVLEILAEIRGTGHGRTAVIALGDEHLEALIAHHLGAVGIGHRFARDGEEVIEQVLRELPDVVLVDAQIGNIDGFRVAEILRSYRHVRRVPMAVTTDSRNPGLTTYARQLGIARLVRRPFASRSLALELREQLDSSRVGE